MQAYGSKGCLQVCFVTTGFASLKGKGRWNKNGLSFFSSFIVGSVYFKQFPKSVVFLLCCCTRGMMHFSENFYLPQPTPTMNLLIWRCHDLHVVPAKTLLRCLPQVEPNQSTAGKRVGACYCLCISSIYTYPTALHFYFYILERVHRRKVSYFDGGGIGT